MNYEAIKQWLAGQGDNSYFELQDDGAGVFFSEWESKLPKPTESDLKELTEVVEHNTPLLQELHKLDGELPRYAEHNAEAHYDSIKEQKQALRAKLKA